MKRKTAKEILAESFRELAQSMPIDKITVKDIITNCGYSQATFYRQFRDKYDLIAWSYTQDLESILDRLKGDVHSWRQALESAAAYFSAHRQYLANLLTHTSGYDSFIVNMTAIHQKTLQSTLEKLSGSAPMDVLGSGAAGYDRVQIKGFEGLTEGTPAVILEEAGETEKRSTDEKETSL